MKLSLMKWIKYENDFIFPRLDVSPSGALNSQRFFGSATQLKLQITRKISRCIFWRHRLDVVSKQKILNTIWTYTQVTHIIVNKIRFSFVSFHVAWFGASFVSSAFQEKKPTKVTENVREDRKSNLAVCFCFSTNCTSQKQRKMYFAAADPSRWTSRDWNRSCRADTLRCHIFFVDRLTFHRLFCDCVVCLGSRGTRVRCNCCGITFFCLIHDTKSILMDTTMKSVRMTQTHFVAPVVGRICSRMINFNFETQYAVSCPSSDSPVREEWRLRSPPTIAIVPLSKSSKPQHEKTSIKLQIVEILQP